MRFTTHGLDERHTYPCSKAEVKAAFGESSLDSASFGISPAFRFTPRYSPRPRILGTVILVLAIYEPDGFRTDRSSLYVFRILKTDFDGRAHAALPALMKGAMREWLAAKRGRPKTEAFGTIELLVEARGPQLLLHETHYR